MKLDFHVHSVRASQPTGAILLYHGWGGTAVSYLEFAQQLSKKGYDVFIPELIRHDQREPFDHPFDSEITTTYFWSVVEQSITEATAIIEQSGWHVSDVIAIGVSMSGFIAHGIMSRQPIKALVAINGGGAYLEAERQFRVRDGRPAIKKEDVPWKLDPISVMDERPRLLLHGDADDIIPLSIQQFYHATAVQAGMAQTTVLDVFSGVNHTVTDAMIKQLIAWLKHVKLQGATDGLHTFSSQ